MKRKANPHSRTRPIHIPPSRAPTPPTDPPKRALKRRKKNPSRKREILAAVPHGDGHRDPDPDDDGAHHVGVRPRPHAAARRAGRPPLPARRRGTPARRRRLRLPRLVPPRAPPPRRRSALLPPRGKLQPRPRAPLSPSLLPPSARSLACFVLSDWAGGFRGGKRIGDQLELAGLGFAFGSQIRWVLGSPRWLGGYFSLEGSGANRDELCCCVLAIPLADLGSGFQWTGGLWPS